MNTPEFLAEWPVGTRVKSSSTWLTVKTGSVVSVYEGVKGALTIKFDNGYVDSFHAHSLEKIATPLWLESA